MQSGNSFCVENVQKMQIFSVEHKGKVAEKSINRSENKKGIREREKWNQEIKIVKCFFLIFLYCSKLQWGCLCPTLLTVCGWLLFILEATRAHV